MDIWSFLEQTWLLWWRMPRGSRLLVSRKDSGADLSLMLNFSLSDPSDFFDAQNFSSSQENGLKLQPLGWASSTLRKRPCPRLVYIHLHRKPKGVGPAYSHLLCCQCFPLSFSAAFAGAFLRTKVVYSRNVFQEIAAGDGNSSAETDF